jgi:hypothetical protein
VVEVSVAIGRKVVSVRLVLYSGVVKAMKNMSLIDTEKCQRDWTARAVREPKRGEERWTARLTVH